jgi:hypothetical protein
MHIQDANRLNAQQSGGLPSFWQTLDRIAITLNLSLETLAEYMELTPKDLIELRRAAKEPSVISAMALSKRINIGFESLVLNTFDYKAMAQQYNGKVSFLPVRYAAPELSRRRTIIPLLDYVECYSGWQTRALLLRRFQLTEAMFVDPDATMNIRLGVDLCNYLYEHYQSTDLLEGMGRYSAVSNLDSPLGTFLTEAETLGDVLELITSSGVGKFIEKNYLWRVLSVNSSACVLEGRPSDEMRAMNAHVEILNPVACMIRSGFISALPQFVSLSPAAVTKTACVAAGDPVCKFHVDLRPLASVREPARSESRHHDHVYA